MLNFSEIKIRFLFDLEVSNTKTPLKFRGASSLSSENQMLNMKV